MSLNGSSFVPAVRFFCAQHPGGPHDAAKVSGEESKRHTIAHDERSVGEVRRLDELDLYAQAPPGISYWEGTALQGIGAARLLQAKIVGVPMSPATMQTEAVTDATILGIIATFDEEIRADRLDFNPDEMWGITRDPANADRKGDELVTLMAFASLTKKPWLGCRVTHAQVARRATSIKKILTLAHSVSWKRIMDVLMQQENT